MRRLGSGTGRSASQAAEYVESKPIGVHGGSLTPTRMRLGLAQINTTVGDLAGNRRRILDAYAGARSDKGAELVVFPELVVCGYPPARPALQAPLRAGRRGLAEGRSPQAIGEVPALIGTVDDQRHRLGAAVLQRRGVLPPRQGRPRSPASACCPPTTSSTRTGISSPRPSPPSSSTAASGSASPSARTSGPTP